MKRFGLYSLVLSQLLGVLCISSAFSQQTVDLDRKDYKNFNVDVSSAMRWEDRERPAIRESVERLSQAFPETNGNPTLEAVWQRFSANQDQLMESLLEEKQWSLTAQNLERAARPCATCGKTKMDPSKAREALFDAQMRLAGQQYRSQQLAEENRILRSAVESVEGLSLPVEAETSYTELVKMRYGQTYFDLPSQIERFDAATKAQEILREPRKRFEARERRNKEVYESLFGGDREKFGDIREITERLKNEDEEEKKEMKERLQLSAEMLLQTNEVRDLLLKAGAVSSPNFFNSGLNTFAGGMHRIGAYRPPPASRVVSKVVASLDQRVGEGAREGLSDLRDLSERLAKKGKTNEEGMLILSPLVIFDEVRALINRKSELEKIIEKTEENKKELARIEAEISYLVGHHFEGNDEKLAQQIAAFNEFQTKWGDAPTVGGEKEVANEKKDCPTCQRAKEAESVPSAESSAKSGK